MATIEFGGKVTNGAGSDLEGLTVQLYTATNWEASGAATATDTTDSNGLWNFDAVAEGTYIVVVHNADSTKKILFDGRNEVQFTRVDIRSTLQVDTINEASSGTGVTIDGVLLKDSGLTTAGDLIVGNGFGLMVGHSALIALAGLTAEAQVLGTAAADSALVIGLWSATDALQGTLRFMKSGHATIGAGNNTIVADNELLGAIQWYPSDGADLATLAAEFFAEVDDSSPAAGDIGTAFVWKQMPGGTGSYLSLIHI